jgi:hypothetical protein
MPIVNLFFFHNISLHSLFPCQYTTLYTSKSYHPFLNAMNIKMLKQFRTMKLCTTCPRKKSTLKDIAFTCFVLHKIFQSDPLNAFTNESVHKILTLSTNISEKLKKKKILQSTKGQIIFIRNKECIRSEERSDILYI